MNGYIAIVLGCLLCSLGWADSDEFLWTNQAYSNIQNEPILLITAQTLI